MKIYTQDVMKVEEVGKREVDRMDRVGDEVALMLGVSLVLLEHQETDSCCLKKRKRSKN